MVGGSLSGRICGRAERIDLCLLLYILGYLLINWLMGFNIYPRYLLPILVPGAVLAARSAIWLWAWLRPRLSAQEGVVIAAALSLTLVAGAWSASETRADFSEDGNDYSGMIDLADTLNAQPVATVIYDHWLGWELGYYMGQWSDKRRVYYPTPEALVSDALKLHETEPRYLVAPTRESVDAWLDALRSAGFTVDQAYLRQSLVAYRLIPPSGA